MGHSFRSFSPRPAGFQAEMGWHRGLWAEWCSPHRSQEAGRRKQSPARLSLLDELTKGESTVSAVPPRSGHPAYSQDLAGYFGSKPCCTPNTGACLEAAQPQQTRACDFAAVCQLVALDVSLFLSSTVSACTWDPGEAACGVAVGFRAFRDRTGTQPS